MYNFLRGELFQICEEKISIFDRPANENGFKMD